LAAVKAARSGRRTGLAPALMERFPLLRARWIIGLKRAGNMESGWAWRLIVPMATGGKCWTARKGREDRVDLVTVATPNATHFEITKAFLENGFHVLCEKPMTMTVEEGEEIVRISRETGNICAVNYGYTGYSLVRHMKAMVARAILERSAGQGGICTRAPC
jgi:hypothetical protein